MPVLLFASFLISILYHIGAMGWFGKLDITLRGVRDDTKGLKLDFL